MENFRTKHINSSYLKQAITFNVTNFDFKKQFSWKSINHQLYPNFSQVRKQRCDFKRKFNKLRKRLTMCPTNHFPGFVDSA